MTIFSPGAGHDTFTIDAGEIVFVPRGYLHHIENIYEGETKFAIAFNHERPEDIGISGAAGSMADRVLGYTFGVDSQYFSNLKRHPHDILITSKESVITTTTTTGTTNYHKSKIPNLHKFNLKGTPPVVQTKGGTASFATANNFEIVYGIACALLTLKHKGIREPHWQPNAAELDYVISGRARMTIFGSGDSVDTFEVGPGEIVFIPPTYFHYIENIGDNADDDDMQFAIFFNHERPEDLGISGSFGAYSNEILASVFRMQTTPLASLPKYQEDLFIVAGGSP